MSIFNIQTPRRKSPMDEKVSHKDDSVIQKAARKSTASAPSDDADKTVKKHTPVKRTSGVLGNSNVTNLVKIPPNSKKLTDASTSWTSLPPSLAKLGKVWQKFIDTIGLVLNFSLHNILKDQALLGVLILNWRTMSYVTGASEVQGISTNGCC